MNIKDVQDLAELAKLELKEEEAEQLIKDMEGILAYVKQIEEVEVSDIEPEYLNINIWREDVSRREDEVGFSRELILEQFPDSKNGFVKVKKIL